MNNLNYVVFDFETGGLDPTYHEVIQVAGKAYHGRTLEPFPADSGGEFCSMMKPLYFDRLQDKALECNKITREELKTAPEQKLVWNQFVEWVQKWNIKGKSPFGAPIPVGKNIRDFDLKFVDVLNVLHCAKKDKTVLFNRKKIDLEDYLHAWFENESDMPDMKMDTVRDFFGISKVGAHRANVDVEHTGLLVMKFLKLHRDLQGRKGKDGTKLIKWRGEGAKCG